MANNIVQNVLETSKTVQKIATDVALYYAGKAGLDALKIVK